MKRQVGVQVLNNQIVPLEVDVQKCRCVKDREYVQPITVFATLIQLQKEEPKWWKEGEIYEYAIDQNEDNSITNPYRIFIDNESNFLTKEEFDKHFMTVESWRNGQIDKITSPDI